MHGTFHIAGGLVDVIIYHNSEDKKKNRGFAFLEYDSHKSASLARRKMMSGRIKIWNNIAVNVDWADPIVEPDGDTMSKVCEKQNSIVLILIEMLPEFALT